MILELGTGTRIQDPTPDQVERGLRSLPGGPDSYAVMKSSDGVFLQVLGGVADGDFHMLEYCEDAEELHFRCTSKSLRLDEVVKVFLAYLQGGDEYKRQLQWQPLAGARRANRFKLLIPVGLIVLGFLAWSLLTRLLR